MLKPRHSHAVVKALGVGRRRHRPYLLEGETANGPTRCLRGGRGSSRDRVRAMNGKAYPSGKKAVPFGAGDDAVGGRGKSIKGVRGQVAF